MREICRTFLVLLLRGALAKLPPPRSQVALSRRRLVGRSWSRLRLPIAHARALHVGVAVGHGGWASELCGSSARGSRGRQVVAACGVAMSRSWWVSSG